MKKVSALAELGLTAQDESTNLLHWRLWASALAKYRSGDWAAAVESAERSITLSEKETQPASTVAAFMVLAMAQYRLKIEQARVAFETGSDLAAARLPRLDGAEGLRESWQDVMIAQILVREARAVIAR